MHSTATTSTGRTTPRSVAVALALIAAIALFAVLCAAAPSTAFAADEEEDQDALYDPIVVAVDDDPTVVNPQKNVTYEKTSGTYKVLLCGVSDANKDALADAVLANLDGDTPVKFTNQSFVDADKYSTTCNEFDKYHCWLGSTSNILTITGWAQRYTNPLTNARFANEDDVLAFMTSGFQDQSCLPTLGYTYFFDGLFGGTHHSWIRTSEATANKPFAGTTHTGFDTSIGAANLVKRHVCTSSLSALDLLEGLQDHALEMSIEGGTSHSVTVTGAVIDTSKQGAERYVAILIADTDNEPSTSSEPPETFAAANAAKAAKTNSYTMYRMKVGDNNGETVEVITNYMKYKPMTYVGSFTQVSYCSDTTREAALETASNATCNARTTGDIALDSLEVFDENYKSKEYYLPTDKVVLMAIIMNMNVDVDFNTTTTGHEYLENRVEAYRDGTLVGTIEDAAKQSLADGIDGMMGTRLMIDLSSYDFLKQPGTYTLKFFLNTGNINEAYVSNDASPQSITYTVKEEGGGNQNENTNGNGNANENSNANNVNNTNAGNATNNSAGNSANSNSSSSSSSKTGDASGIAAIAAALAAALACSLALIAVRKKQ